MKAHNSNHHVAYRGKLWRLPLSLCLLACLVGCGLADAPAASETSFDELDELELPYGPLLDCGRGEGSGLSFAKKSPTEYVLSLQEDGTSRPVGYVALEIPTGQLGYALTVVGNAQSLPGHLPLVLTQLDSSAETPEIELRDDGAALALVLRDAVPRFSGLYHDDQEMTFTACKVYEDLRHQLYAHEPTPRVVTCDSPPGQVTIVQEGEAVEVTLPVKEGDGWITATYTARVLSFYQSAGNGLALVRLPGTVFEYATNEGDVGQDRLVAQRPASGSKFWQVEIINPNRGDYRLTPTQYCDAAEALR